MALYSDIFIDQGSTFSSTITVADSGVRTDLTGWSVRGQIRKHYTSSSAINLTSYIIGDAVNGEIFIGLTPTQTGEMKAGRYMFDVEIFKTSPTEVIRVSEGEVTVSPRITNL